MALMKCEECGKQVSDKAITCPHCGAPVDKVKCEECGKTFSYTLDACPHCGAPVEIEESTTRRNLLPRFNGFAIFGFCLSLCSIFFQLLSIFSLTFSWASLYMIREANPKERGEGLAIAGMVISIIMIVVFIFNILDGGY